MSAIDTLRANVAMAQAVAVVIDRENSADVAPSIAKMGGGWAGGISMWDPAQMEFLLLIAPNLERCQRRAPLVLMAKDIGAFVPMLRMGLALLDDVRCLWVRTVGKHAFDVLSKEILLDSQAGGSA